MVSIRFWIRLFVLWQMHAIVGKRKDIRCKLKIAKSLKNVETCSYLNFLSESAAYLLLDTDSIMIWCLLSTITDSRCYLALVSRLSENKNSYKSLFFTTNHFVANLLKHLRSCRSWVSWFAPYSRHASGGSMFKTFMKRQLIILVITFLSVLLVSN